MFSFVGYVPCAIELCWSFAELFFCDFLCQNPFTQETFLQHQSEFISETRNRKMGIIIIIIIVILIDLTKININKNLKRKNYELETYIHRVFLTFLKFAAIAKSALKRAGKSE